MIWSVRTPAEFATLIGGPVVRSSNLAMHRARLGFDGEPARVACAIPVAVGSAPVRNRLRRRLRAWAGSADLSSGYGYFVRFRPSASGLRGPELRAEFDDMLAGLQ